MLARLDHAVVLPNHLFSGKTAYGHELVVDIVDVTLDVGDRDDGVLVQGELLEIELGHQPSALFLGLFLLGNVFIDSENADGAAVGARKRDYAGFKPEMWTTRRRLLLLEVQFGASGSQNGGVIGSIRFDCVSPGHLLICFTDDILSRVMSRIPDE